MISCHKILFDVTYRAGTETSLETRLERKLPPVMLSNYLRKAQPQHDPSITETPCILPSHPSTHPQIIADSQSNNFFPGDFNKLPVIRFLRALSRSASTRSGELLLSLPGSRPNWAPRGASETKRRPFARGLLSCTLGLK